MSSRLARIEDGEKLAAEAEFDPEVVASLCSVSLRQLGRSVELQYGGSPGTRTRELRRRRAATLIQKGYSTKAAAEELGFSNSSHFCHEFKKLYGVPPQFFAPLRGGKMSR